MRERAQTISQRSLRSQNTKGSQKRSRAKRTIQNDNKTQSTKMRLERTLVLLLDPREEE
jgi:hypothetical protein